MLKSFFFGRNSAVYGPIYFSTDHNLPVPGPVCLLCLALQIFLIYFIFSKGKVSTGIGKCIYIALIFVVHARRSGMDHTVLPAITPMPAFTS